MLVRESVTLPEGQEILEPVIIAASHVVVDGNGARIVGPGREGERASFQGVGISAAGCHNVVLRNFVVSGFETGIEASDGMGWVIERCDASGNYADAEFGWGEYKRVGGIVLTRMRACVIRGSVAARVWNGLDMCECCDNLVQGNRFSHCTNVCLRMDRSCRNIILENDLSHGRRLKPGEIHARDSAGVLIESGSDNNFFHRNDIRHGGDGIFVRSLNGWVSSGNVFIENDCSHAHNNGIEAWARDNIYVRNTTNRCSYGFWLGCSDGAVLLGNEAGWCAAQGGQRDLPPRELGHGGIVGLSRFADSIVADGNDCHDNEGAGIVIGGNLKQELPEQRARHWIVQANRLERNQRAIWARRADFLDLRDNRARDNSAPDVFDEVGAMEVTEGPTDTALALRPAASIRGPRRGRVGEPVIFDASTSRNPGNGPLEFAWDIAGEPGTGSCVRHVFRRPGPCAVTLKVDNGVWAAMAVQTVYVAASGEEPATEDAWASWQWDARDPEGNPGRVDADADDDCVAGLLALRVRASGCAGYIVTGRFPLGHRTRPARQEPRELRFWLKSENPNVTEFKGANPVIGFEGARGSLSYAPVGDDGKSRNLLLGAPAGGARRIWQYVVVPLDGGSGWRREVTGEADPGSASSLVFRFEDPGPQAWTFWIDGLELA